MLESNILLVFNHVAVLMKYFVKISFRPVNFRSKKIPLVWERQKTTNSTQVHKKTLSFPYLSQLDGFCLKPCLTRGKTFSNKKLNQGVFK